jgi:SAM-dependent methyltransferase
MGLSGKRRYTGQSVSAPLMSKTLYSKRINMESEFDAKLKHCLACGSERFHHRLTDFRGVDIDECECGMRFMNPQYSDAHLQRYYENYISDEDFHYWHDAAVYCHDWYLSLVERCGAKPGRLLDVGCGNGYLLEAGMKRGWTATGYDVDPDTTAHVAKRLGIAVHSGDFMSVDGEYELVAMHQVLEHVKHPTEYLAKISSLLVPGGYLFVAVPNITSLSNRLKSCSEAIGLRRKRIGKYYDADHHLGYYSPPVLKEFLQRAGYDVLLVRNCHSVRPGQSRLKRLLMRNLTERLFWKSTFLVVARKRT